MIGTASHLLYEAGLLVLEQAKVKDSEMLACQILCVRLVSCFKGVQVAASPHSEAAGSSSGTDTLPGPLVVQVLTSDKASIKHTMHKPGSNFAACDCNTGQQGSVCKHQVAWLLAQYPYGDCAERLIVKMLGTRLGFVGGCTMEDIQDLTMELCRLQLQQPHTAACVPSNCLINENQDGAAAMHLEKENRAQGSNLPAQAVPGQQALANHRRRIEAIVQQQLEAVLRADPLRQKDIMIQQESAQRSLLQVMQAAAQRPEEAQPVSNFKETGDGRFSRKRSCLEGHRNSKHSDQQQPAQRRPRQEFVSTRVRDDSACISKAFGSGRGAKEAARHVAACLRTSHSTTAIQRPPVQSEPPPGRPPRQQHQQAVQALPLHPSSYPPPQQQQRQYQQPQSIFAPPVMPESPLKLLYSYVLNQDRQRLEAAAVPAIPVPQNSLAFPPYGGSQPSHRFQGDV
jgi:hypothetical protein